MRPFRKTWRLRFEWEPGYEAILLRVRAAPPTVCDTVQRFAAGSSRTFQDGIEPGNAEGGALSRARQFDRLSAARQA